MFGADIFNEPFLGTWATGNNATDWNTAAERIGKLMREKRGEREGSGGGDRGSDITGWNTAASLFILCFYSFCWGLMSIFFFFSRISYCF